MSPTKMFLSIIRTLSAYQKELELLTLDAKSVCGHLGCGLALPTQFWINY